MSRGARVSGEGGVPALVDVAVGVPIAGPLTYEVGSDLVPLIEPGMRVRVPVGNRLLTGVVLGPARVPAGDVALREITELLDESPVLSEELLSLAAFISEYYLAPIGEVVRAMIPPDLEPWGRRRVRLTNRGVFYSGEEGVRGRLLDFLRDHGPARLGELGRRLGVPDVGDLVEQLREDGHVVVDGGSRRGGRYRQAVELGAGETEELLVRCGRSGPGREVVRWLAEAGRPAAVEEVTTGVGCGPAVVRRLVGLGVLRSFTEIRRLDLGRQRLSGPLPEAITLRPDQEAALAPILSALASRVYGSFLLAGMTGSGKTEVYLRAGEKARELGLGVVILVPEIALVPALARTLIQRFGEGCAILHSGLSKGERRQEWERIRSGEARVVLGPRSALFAPVQDLGLIVVDEEQDPAYKQETTPRYHGRDLALVRASRLGAVAILTSATPSLESRFNVVRGKLSEVTLTRRVGHGRLPEGKLVDLRREPGPRRPGEIVFSELLLAEIRAALDRDEQIVLLRNRRGYAPQMLCRACGEDHRCDDCGLPRTYHRRSRVLVCHYCGSTRSVPTSCGSCGEEALEAVGAGTERVEERFADLFPEVPVAVLDRDTARRAGGPAAVLEAFGSGEARVLIGTQMVSKGHHFPRVALAGVLAADSYLGFPDFRAVEKTYSLLTQLAGRAGRGDRPGTVVVQTYHPDHYAIRAALANDDRAFAEEEMRFRRIFHYPPFTRMIHLLVRDPKRESALEAIEEIARCLEGPARDSGARLSGPAPAPLERLRGKWRFQLLVRGPSGKELRRLVEGVLPTTRGPQVVVDVDPYDLM